MNAIDGYLLPFMLSDLILAAQKALSEYGDMPIGVETCVPGYEYNEEHSLPVSDPPAVVRPSWIEEYWIGKFKLAFVLSGV